MDTQKRIIKFRQWLGKCFHYFEFKDGMCSGVAEASLKKYPIMQYTGLKDKNGKEIYESDFVHVVTAHANYIKEITNVCGETYNGFNIAKSYMNSKDCHIEVVGNIYENPEILKEADNG